MVGKHENLLFKYQQEPEDLIKYSSGRIIEDCKSEDSFDEAESSSSSSSSKSSSSSDDEEKDERQFM
jgi:hypothetical protein